jgi:hypothetical protein
MRSNLHISDKIICRNNFKGYFLLFLAINFLSAFSTNLRSDVQQIYRQANGRLSPEGASNLDKYYVASTTDCRGIDQIGGWLWRCIYKDGFSTYNCFRKCRGSIEVANYFLGLVDGDCDSFSESNGSLSKVCYSLDSAKKYYRVHGSVITIRLVKECRP